ncbi:Nif3-like dinuclear metal center hexameric protein [Castellaniella sp.]|uniref:Nif3-like dinuclear metal center hexameric protein n=1 Tax=Castellaniella sp. TaxID=1955812 RepID=UPI003C7216D8
MKTVSDLLDSLNIITGGRMVPSVEAAKDGEYEFVILKSSGIYGKSVLEIPSLIYGDPAKQIKKIAVCMTLTEQGVELAGATGVDAIVAHHPVADAASCGGVTLRDYLDLYGIAVLECHEAFHGLHPGIAHLHGHTILKSSIAYGGIHGNVMYVGAPLKGIHSMRDILLRLDQFMGLDVEEQMLEAERCIKGSTDIQEGSLVTRGRVLLGDPDSPIKKLVHIFPHTGFTADHLRSALKDDPDIDTVLASISRVYEGHALVEAASELGLKLMVGNSHVLEIMENGMPLARALQRLLDGVDVQIFRERVTSTPIDVFGNARMQEYALRFSEAHLLGKNALTYVE